MNSELSNKVEYLKGDKILWILIIIISLFSAFPVYSASSNLEYIVNRGSTTSSVIIKHLMFIGVGLVIMRVIGMVKYQHIGKLSTILLITTIFLLVGTLFMGQTIDGASASRWLRIPGTPISFQPSAFAYLMLLIYLCRYLTLSINRERLAIEFVAFVFFPIILVFLLVAKDNGSTALLIMLGSLGVLVLGQMRWKYILSFVGASTTLGVMLILVLLNTNIMSSNRVHTWVSRVETFAASKTKTDALETEATKAKNYQVMQARAAIVHGGFFGMGPGKSALKQMLPQSASDFIFAIIIEEYGLFGASILMIFYVFILIRIMIIASKIQSFFGTLLSLSMGLMFFMQLAVNIAVAVNLIPVTGQPLPFISYGGTSMLVTYIQMGIILNVSSQIQVYDEEGIGKKQKIAEMNDIA